MATSGDTETTVVTEESSASSSGTSGGMPTTIQEIQMGAIPLDTAVEVVGAICTGVGGNGFFMQDPAGGEWSGIWVFTGMGGLVPQLGDELTVTGVYEEYFELSEINASDGTIEVTMSPGEANVPVPETLEALDFGESWESVFVRVAGTLVVEEIGMGAIHEFSVDDGAGSVWIDDQLYDATLGDFTGFGVGASFTEIRGPVNFSFKQFKVAPRSVDDLMGYTPPL